LGDQTFAIFDHDALSEYIEGDTPEKHALRNRALRLYLTESPRYLADIRRGVETNDANVIRRAAHTLKSSSNMVGAKYLSELARSMEAASAEAKLPDHAAVRAIESTFQRAAALIEQQMNRAA
jgi:HPt (histidine-containing phosphotransfer) domain-containing protein